MLLITKYLFAGSLSNVLRTFVLLKILEPMSSTFVSLLYAIETKLEQYANASSPIVVMLLSLAKSIWTTLELP